MEFSLHPRMEHGAERGQRAGPGGHGATHVARKLLAIVKERGDGGCGDPLGPQVHDRGFEPQVILLDQGNRVPHRGVVAQLGQGLVHVAVPDQGSDLRLHGRGRARDQPTRGARFLREGRRGRHGGTLSNLLVVGLRGDQARPRPGHRLDPQASPIPPGPHAAVIDARQRLINQVRRLTEKLIARLHQVARRLPRRRTRPIDPGTHQELGATRTSHRHVRQAPLLALRVHAQGATVVSLHPLGVRGGGLGLALHVQREGRQVGAVPAQRVRQRARIRQPRGVVRRLIQPRHRLALVVRREDAVAQPEDDDAIPLESLGSVDRHDLHGARIGFPQGRLEPVLALVRHAQVGEE